MFTKTTAPSQPKPEKTRPGLEPSPKSGPYDVCRLALVICRHALDLGGVACLAETSMTIESFSLLFLPTLLGVASVPRWTATVSRVNYLYPNYYSSLFALISFVPHPQSKIAAKA